MPLAIIQNALNQNIIGNVPLTSELLAPNIVRFLTSGTYTPTVNMKYVTVEMVAAGGGGGGAIATAAGQFAMGASGASGGYLNFLATAAQVGASQALTVAVATTATAGIAGVNGGATTFGTLATVTGGTGGVASVATANFAETSISLGGNFTLTTGTRFLALVGENGEASTGGSANTAVYLSLRVGTGGGTPLGTGGTAVNRANTGIVGVDGMQGTGFGSGGSGSGSANGSGARIGGIGSAGIIIITEFF